MPQYYSRAPIIEAVIELRFERPIQASLLERVSDALGRYYPNLQEFAQFQVQVGPQPDGGAPVRTSSPDKVWRRSAHDEQHVAMVGPNAFGVSQLAPYEGWDAYFGRFRRDWEIWTEKAGRPKITRVGLRYINRIDIPAEAEGLVHQNEYVQFLINAPPGLGPTNGYAVNAIFRAPKSPCTVVINTGMASFQMVPGFASVNLDIDLAAERDLPPNDSGLFALLEEMRDDKNFIFEECITDRARAIFK